MEKLEKIKMYNTGENLKKSKSKVQRTIDKMKVFGT